MEYQDNKHKVTESLNERKKEVKLKEDQTSADCTTEISGTSYSFLLHLENMENDVQSVAPCEEFFCL